MQQLVSLSVASARDALQNGDPIGAIEWLANVPSDQERPLRSRVHYALGKRALSLGRWVEAQDHFGYATKLGPTSAAEMRVGLLRRRSPLLSDSRWATLKAAVDAPDRLPEGGMAPLASIWACGAYYSRRNRGSPWSRFVSARKGARPRH